jgi:hypothetical protein
MASILVSQSPTPLKLQRFIAAPNVTGTNWSVIPSPDKPFIVIAIECTMQTSVTAATRQLSIITNNQLTIPPGATQAASLTYNYSWFLGATETITSGGTPTVSAPLPQQYYLPAGATVASAVQNLQAGDVMAFTAIQFITL